GRRGRWGGPPGVGSVYGTQGTGRPEDDPGRGAAIPDRVLGSRPGFRRREGPSLDRPQDGPGDRLEEVLRAELGRLVHGVVSRSGPPSELRPDGDLSVETLYGRLIQMIESISRCPR